jgi:Uma2 family endonuclease
MITSLSQLDFNKRYTYADYILWQFKERVELLKGRLFPMSAPNVAHQTIVSNLHGYLWQFTQGTECKVFPAPFDVRLPLPEHKITHDKITTVVQPDISVVCDESKLDKQGCVGAPDLVVEILSPGNPKREVKDKFELYQDAGVYEYWVVDPDRRVVHIYRRGIDKRFIAVSPLLTDEDTLDSSVLQGFSVSLEHIFPAEKE